MKNQWSKIMALLLLCSFGIAPILRVGWISVQKKSIRKQVERQLKLDAAETLILSKVQFPDLKKGKEIYFNEDKFDLLAVEDHGDFWKVTAINDRIEKQLEAGMHQNGDIHKKNGKNSFKLVTSDWSLMQKTIGLWSLGSQELGAYFIHTDLVSGGVAELLQPPEGIGFRYEINMGSTRKS